ncbi:MAG TPA: hypothetical protein VEK39_01660 [Solirubrobacterales bacterium]|nr:hypothetical protein [Solirubrobacterales bacterium]
MSWGILVRSISAAIACALVAPAVAAAEPAPWMIGTAQVDITPTPLPNNAADVGDDPGEFPEVPCDRSFFSGHRDWYLEEPYQDTDGSGEFSYPLGNPEPFCDLNANGRWDGIYQSGGVDHHAEEIHDPIDARAVAISDGAMTIVLVSVVAQGIHENYTHEMRARADQLTGGAINGMVVSANHNESSPDTVGIYGAPDVGGVAGANSGIDEYYMDFLVERVAQAAADAYAALQPASLWEREFELPANLRVDLSHNFPTTADDRSPAAIDPKVRVLQARRPDGTPIVTIMNLAAHNQEIGHSGNDALQDDISSDWPGYFHDELESRLGGTAMFLVGDNGSEEDPETVPPVSTAQFPECSESCYPQAEATGDALADAVADRVPDADPVRFGPVGARRDEFFAPIENNLFKAAAVAGVFGERSTYTGGIPTGRTGEDVRTEVNVLDVGPDLQFIANPGEAFPALMVGSPWGVEDAGCPNRANPPVPTWHASATYRFQVGLANDLIGYELPAWAFSSIPGAFTNEPPYDDTCVNDQDDVDPAGHQHKLETEGLGPSASNMVAEHLTALLDQTPDQAATILPGRFIQPDGSLSRRAEGAVGIWLADPGSDTLAPGTGTIVATPEIGFFGDRAVDANGGFMDYDGAAQDGPDITTRGMRGPVASRYYVDVYPALQTTQLGAPQPPVPPQPGEPGEPGEPPAACADNAPPHSSLRSDDIAVGARRLRLHGSSVDAGCAGQVDHVEIAIAKHVGGHNCRFLSADGGLSGRASCKHRSFMTAEGAEQFSLAIDTALPNGRYSAIALGTDARGNRETPAAANRARFRVG